MDDNFPIGSNPLPIDAQIRLAEFLDWLDTKYETEHGVTSLFWELSYMVGNQIKGGQK